MSEVSDFQYLRLDRNEQDLINTLNALIPPGAVLSYDPLGEMPDRSAVVSLLMEFDGTLQAKLNAYDDYFLDEDELLRELSVTQLPPELLSVAFEQALQPALTQLSDLLQCEVRFTPDEEGSFAGKYRLLFSYNYKGHWVPCSLELQDEGAVRTFLQILGRLSAVPAENGLEELLSCALPFDLGKVTLNGQELASLRPGDVLMPDLNYLAGGELRVCLPLVTLHFSYQAAAASFKGCSVPVFDRDEGLSMSEEQSFENEQGGEAPLSESVNAQDLQFEVAFEVDRQLLSYADLMALRRGSVINLTCSPKSPVSLRVNGRMIGTGRLVQVGDQIGVQLTEIKR